MVISMMIKLISGNCRKRFCSSDGHGAGSDVELVTLNEFMT